MDAIHKDGMQFGRFLIERSLVSSKAVPYMQRWVEMFLHFACDYRAEPFEQVLDRFTHHLEGQTQYEPQQID